MGDIRKLIQEQTPPQEWFCQREHPINKLCYLTDGPAMRLVWVKDALDNAPELLLWRLYSEILKHWMEFYEDSFEKTCNECFYSHPNEQAQALHEQSRAVFIQNGTQMWIDTGVMPKMEEE